MSAMKIQILQVAPSKNPSIKDLEAEYEKWVSGMLELTVTSVAASKADEMKRAQEEEKVRLLEKLDPKATRIVLDETGKLLSSLEFADLIRKERDFGPGKIQFIIGGSHGLHPDVKAQASLLLSFSKMTFPHELIRVFLKEQLFRACAILAGKTYHK